MSQLLQMLMHFSLPLLLIFGFLGEPPLPTNTVRLAALTNYVLASAIFAGVSFVQDRRAFIRFVALFNFVFLGFIPLLLQYHVSAFAFLVPGGAHIEHVALLTIMGTQVTLCIGYYMAVNSQWRLPSFGLSWIRPISAPQPFGLVVGVIGVLITLVGIALAGGPLAILAARDEFIDSIDTESNGLVTLSRLAIAIPVACSAVTILARLLAHPKNRTAASILGFSFVLLMFLFANNPLFNPRFWVGTTFGAMILCTLYFTVPSVIRWLPGLLALLLLIAFPYADLYRRTTTASLDERLSGSEGLVTEITDKGDFSMYLQYLAVIQLTEQRGIDYGKQLGGAALFFVPRRVWPGKPTSTGGVLAEAYDLRQMRLATPLVSEIHCAFGAIGALVGFLLFGVLIGAADNVLVSHTDDREMMLLLLLFYAPFTVMLLRGSFMVAFANGIYLLFFAVLILGLSAMLCARGAPLNPRS